MAAREHFQLAETPDDIHNKDFKVIDLQNTNIKTDNIENVKPIKISNELDINTNINRNNNFLDNQLNDDSVENNIRYDTLNEPILETLVNNYYFN